MRNRMFGAGLALVLLAGTGCRVQNHKDGNNDDVKIATPFGGMSVKTNDATVQSNVGMAVYPGAALVRKDDNNGSADVSLSFGDFHLGVKALSYRTADAPDKVMAFYRKDLARYGAVILCKDMKAVGTPARTQDGLSCEADYDGKVHVENDNQLGELKTGSKQHQHLVELDRDGTGTKFGLIALDLPGHLGGDEKQSGQ